MDIVSLFLYTTNVYSNKCKISSKNKFHFKKQRKPPKDEDTTIRLIWNAIIMLNSQDDTTVTFSFKRLFWERPT